MNEISITGETYSEIARHKFTLYPTSSLQIFKDYMETRRSEWEDDKYFTSEQVKDMDHNKYNNLLTSGRWYNKDTKVDKILDIT